MRWSWLPWLLVFTSACGLFERDSRSPRRSNRQLVSPGMPHLAPGGIPEGSPRLPAELADGPTAEELGPDVPGLVVFVVLDTVRADHLSACGYERPTSPNLEALRDRGAALSCDAYSPATWTLPSHATFFTGLDVEDHGLLRKGLPLTEATPTLAESFAKRGYQTMFLSANPIIKKTTGLTRGFHRVRVSPGLVSPILGEGMAKLLRFELAQIDPSRPLFVFINIFDAHEPYAPIPQGVDWVPPQEPVYFKPADVSDTNPYRRFVAGTMGEEERAAYLERIVNGYDHAVSLADDSLGRVIKVLERQGLGKHGVRMLVTSDHGENLGDHGMLRHDGPPWESTAKVPFVYLDTTRSTPLTLPTPLSAGVAFHLLLEGALPEVMGTPRSGSIDYGGRPDPRYQDALALWPGQGRKWMWQGGEALSYDLAADPGETTPTPLQAGTEAHAALTEAFEAHIEAKERAAGMDVDDKLLKMLEKMGYVE